MPRVKIILCAKDGLSNFYTRIWSSASTSCRPPHLFNFKLLPVSDFSQPEMTEFILNNLPNMVYTKRISWS